MPATSHTTEIIRVEIDLQSDVIASEAGLQFLIRQRCRSVGIPIGPWGSEKPERGTLRWFEDTVRKVRVIEWRE